MINFEINKLFIWYHQNKRDLPWRHTINPYLVWLSEIILQQTRVEQGLPYYEKFTTKYPTVFDLANAPLDEVYKLWEGLGYYSRANNLHITAKFVVEHLDGVFPNSYKELIKLKGVGDYTASAISSFCFGEPKPVLDGNVFRVISRIYGVDDPINKPQSRKVFKAILEEVIPPKQPALFNQAIMEFGALHCTPKKPHCTECPFIHNCFAFNKRVVANLPVKLKSKKASKRYFNYLVHVHKNKVFLKKRSEKDIWRNLYEFPLKESESFYKNEHDDDFSFKSVSKPYKQILSHQHIYAKFYLMDSNLIESKGEWVHFDDLHSFGVHVLMRKFLTESTWLHF